MWFCQYALIYCMSPNPFENRGAFNVPQHGVLAVQKHDFQKILTGHAVILFAADQPCCWTANARLSITLEMVYLSRENPFDNAAMI